MWLLFFCCFWCVPWSALALEEGDLQKFLDDALRAGGGEVVIPPGEYVIHKGLTVVDARKLKLVGMDRERTVLRLGKDADVLLALKGACEEVVVRNLTFDGAGAGRGWALRVKPEGERKAQRVKMEGCIVKGGFAGGVVFTGTDEAAVEGCSFADVTGEAVRWEDGAAKGALRGCWLTRGGLGVGLSGVEGCLIQGNEFRKMTKGVWPEEGTSGLQVMDNGFVDVVQVAPAALLEDKLAWAKNEVRSGSR